MTTTPHTPLRVLQVTPRYFPDMGGAETHVHEVSWRLARSGVDVTILTADREGNRPREEEVNGVKIRRVPAWPAKRDFYFAPDVSRFVREGHWDLVHCQNYHTLMAPMAMLAARRAGVPYIVTFHSGGYSSRLRMKLRPLQALLVSPLLAGAERLVGVSRFEADYYRRMTHLPASQFVVIANGSSMPHVEHDDATPGATSLILSVGRLERYKGHHRLIAAMPGVLKQCPEARLRVVGAGPYQPELEQLAQRLGVATQVEIKGIPSADRAGMARLLNSAALVTLMSEYEAHPIAVLEALALRRPLLVADTSGLSEFAERGLARAVPVNASPNEVARAVVEQLRHPLLPEHIDLPTWDECAANVLKLYHECLKGRRAERIGLENSSPGRSQIGVGGTR